MVILYGDLANTFVDAQISGGGNGTDLDAVGGVFAEDIGYYATGLALLGLGSVSPELLLGPRTDNNFSRMKCLLCRTEQLELSRNLQCAH